MVVALRFNGNSPIKHETETSTPQPKQDQKNFGSNNQLSHYIALQAESLAERLMHTQDFKSASEGSAIATTRLRTLIETLGNDDNQLQKYLDWSGLPSPEDLPLGEPCSKEKFISRQPWVRYLEEIFDQLDQSKQGQNHYQTTRKESKKTKEWFETQHIYNEITSEEINQGAGVHRYACIVAIQALREACSDKEFEALSTEALHDVTRHLWAMQHRSCRALFRRTQNLHANLGRRTNQQEISFASWLINEKGYKTLLREHCALARLIAQGIEFWVRDTRQLIQRFNADKKELAILCDSQTIKTITRIEDGLSDPHDGKQFVKRIKFNNGSGLVYKPRNCSSLQKLSEAIQILNEKHSDINLRVPKCVDKSNYAWIELIEHRQCTSTKEVTSYFHRCGQLVAILYLTRTNDIHHENLIASGEWPVLIDTDTLFYPGFLDLDEAWGTSERQYTELAIEESVLSSGLLPLWDNINSNLRDSSGMSHLNEESGNTVILNGNIQEAHNYTCEITEGFRSVMHFALQTKPLFAEIIQSFYGCRTRAIYRPTRIYEQLKQSLLAPKYLIDGITRSIGIDYIKTAALTTDEKPCAWPLINEEAQMLYRDDTPMFSILCEEQSLELNNETKLPLRSGLKIAKERHLRLSFQSIKYQEELVRASCYFSSELQGNSVNQPLIHCETDAVDTDEHAKDELFKKIAGQISAKLSERSHHSPDYGRSWIGINILEDYGKMQLSNAGLSLYNGNAGIALAIAAQCKSGECNQDEKIKFKIIGDTALKPILSLSKKQSQITSMIESFGLGAMTGLGSLIFSCTAYAKLQNDSQALDAAIALSKVVNSDVITKESCADVMTGLAGLLIAIVELEQHYPQQMLRDICIEIGDQICNLMCDVGQNHYAWPSPKGPKLLGLSHGAAGISMALFRLYQQSDLHRFKKAALEGVAYENVNCDPITGHWLDLRQKQPSIMNSWCNGAPGIGLARLEMLKIDPNATLLADLQKAIDLIAEDQSTELDQLCCGALGHSDLLLSAGSYFQREDWIGQAKSIAKISIDISRKRGGFRLLKTLPEQLSMPGLMQGEAGIAYQLLRLTQPNLLPSILALCTK